MRVIGASSGLGLMMLLTAALAAWPDFDTQACSLLQDANGAAKSLAGTGTEELIGETHPAEGAAHTGGSATASAGPGAAGGSAGGSVPRLGLFRTGRFNHPERWAATPGAPFCYKTCSISPNCRLKARAAPGRFWAWGGRFSPRRECV